MPKSGSRLRQSPLKSFGPPFSAGVAALVLAASATGAARAAEAESWNAHFQATYVWQLKPAFHAAYSGVNSLLPSREKSYSFTATAAFGWRPLADTELYFDGEAVQGVPLSNLTGLGGLSNGELQKTSGSNPVFYRARAFARQTWKLGEDDQTLEAGFNQLGGTTSARRVVMTIGNLALTDVFDANRYAHDPRTQFLNWALFTQGAYDFAADSRGYSWGLVVEFADRDWSVRGGRFALPKESNGLAIDPKIFWHHGDQIELEHRHEVGGRTGAVRVLAFRNVARMGSFDDALAEAQATGGTPDVARVRRRQVKAGWGLSAEQDLTSDLGAFVRIGKSDGRAEPYAFAAIDRSFSTGATIRGSAWKRAGDQLGLAFAANGLSTSHRRYLAAGGADFFLGDGTLRYGTEKILEIYYSAALSAKSWVTVDFQRIVNPGYNRDRGPVTLVALRLHAEY